MTDVISTAESRVSEANYPTFETRLVPIDAHPKDGELTLLINTKNGRTSLRWGKSDV